MRNRFFLLLDVALIPIAVFISFVLRLETFDLFPEYTHGLLVLGCAALIVVPLVFWRVGIYARYWPYASVEELLLLLGAITFSAILAGGLSFLMLRLIGDRPVASMLPRSVPLIFLMLALVVTAAPRLTVRALSGGLGRHLPRSVRFYQRGGMSSEKGKDRLHASLADKTPVLIMGAGDAGAMIVRELQKNPHLGMEPIGFLDDDLGKHDVRIHGVPVRGGRNDIPGLARKYRVRQVIIAMPTAPGKVIREIVRICEQAGVQTKLIPGIYELIGGTVSVNQLRNVQIEDLLRRDPVQTDIASVSQLIRGKRVLVTGGGGSIGSELCRQVLRFGPTELVLLGHGENSIFETHNELKRHSPQVEAAIADIRFFERIKAVMQEHQPDIVFHAAAHKHVALMERNPSEAVTNNILGTRNLLKAAVSCGVESFVMISTDKAVNPSGLMGASKRVAELLVHQAAHDMRYPCDQSMTSSNGAVGGVLSAVPLRRYCAVRFGNVLGSRGSIIPIFKQQIAEGGPITITHPEMRRYFMTIPEAVQLVLQASVLGRGGEVFVLDMGEPVKIVDLARDLVRLSGLELGRDIDIVFTGMVPGEKLFEELFLPNEVYQRTQHEKIFIAANASNAIPPMLDECIAELEEAAQRNDDAAIVAGLCRLVPEFAPSSQSWRIAPAL